MIWTPWFRRSRPIIIDPGTAHVLQLRQPSGLEAFQIDRSVTVIVLLITGARVELGVYPEYLDILGRVFDLSIDQ